MKLIARFCCTSLASPRNSAWMAEASAGSQVLQFSQAWAGRRTFLVTALCFRWTCSRFFHTLCFVSRKKKQMRKQNNFLGDLVPATDVVKFLHESSLDVALDIFIDKVMRGKVANDAPKYFLLQIDGINDTPVFRISDLVAWAKTIKKCKLDGCANFFVSNVDPQGGRPKEYCGSRHQRLASASTGAERTKKWRAKKKHR